MEQSLASESDEEYKSADEEAGEGKLSLSDQAERLYIGDQQECGGAFTTHGEQSNQAASGLGSEGERERTSDGGDFVAGLDNRYVSEGATLKEGKVELTEEQIKEMKEQALKVKTLGNEAFRSGDYEKAIELYSEAINGYPPSCEQELAVCHANRAACHMKLENHEDVVKDCTKAVELKPDYLKAMLRRAQSYEALDKLEDSLEDYKRVLELDPSQSAARQAVMRLPEQIKEQHEKLKAEMLGKLKELGNAVLKPFGLSTENFQLQQDPSTGGYSVNFRK